MAAPIFNEGDKVFYSLDKTDREYTVTLRYLDDMRNWFYTIKSHTAPESIIVQHVPQLNLSFTPNYKQTNTMTTTDFSGALKALKEGRKVYREGWNGRGMWLVLIRPMLMINVFPDYNNKSDQEEMLPTLPYIGMKTADGKFVPWLASQTDMLGTDWCIKGEEGTVNKAPKEEQKPDLIPVPASIKFYGWMDWKMIVSPNGKLLLRGTDGTPEVFADPKETCTPGRNIGKAYLVPCKRKELKQGDIAFRDSSALCHDFTDLTSYCVILNDRQYAYWESQMDMSIGDQNDLSWFKVIFE